jgi:hypothetical protein
LRCDCSRPRNGQVDINRLVDFAGSAKPLVGTKGPKPDNASASGGAGSTNTPLPHERSDAAFVPPSGKAWRSGIGVKEIPVSQFTGPARAKIEQEKCSIVSGGHFLPGTRTMTEVHRPARLM